MTMQRGLVVAGGCFDIIHHGHLLHLRAARAAGEKLIVLVTADAFVNKGPGRPVFNQHRRTDMLRELRCVDEVYLSYAPVPTDLLLTIKPEIYVKGAEYRGRLPEQEAVESYGGRVLFTDTEVFSSTSLLGWV